MLGLCCAAAMMGCRQDMHDQPRGEPLEGSTFFEDGRASRPLVEGTVPRGHLRIDDHLYTGQVDGRFVDTFPFPVTREVLERGRERYDIFCSTCHDATGSGNGMIVQRGFQRPPSYHVDRLRDAPVGYLYDVITNGFGAMYDQADKVAPRDRWAIVAYIRALQLSQHAEFEDVPEAMRVKLEEGAR